MPNVYVYVGKIKQRYSNGPCELRIEAKTNRCLYRYNASGVVFEFDLLSEVGAPFHPYFQDIIRQEGLIIETVEINAKPWIYDRLKTQ